MIGKYAKWIIGALGWANFGAIGGLLGYLIGSAFDSGDKISKEYSGQSRQGTTRGAYNASLIVLIAAVIKADGKILRSELDYVKAFFVRNFGQEQAQDAVLMLRDILKQDIPVNDVCAQIAKNMDRESRLQLLHFLYGLSAADGEVHPSEQKVLEQIALHMNMSSAEHESIRAMFIQNTDWAYTVLELTEDASDSDVKKAYRKMAIKYHPDKVSHLGEEHQTAAKEKFQKLTEAYEAIKKERNL